MFPQPGQDILSGCQGKGTLGLAFLFDFLTGGMFRGKVRHRCGKDKGVLFLPVLLHRFHHVGGGGDGNPIDPHGTVQGGDTADQGNFRSPLPSGLGYGVAHLAGGVIGEKPHWVHRFPGCSGGNQNFLSRQILGGQGFFHPAVQGFGFRQTAFPGLPAGQQPFFRRNHLHTPLLQSGKVLLGGRVAVHMDVHGGAHQHRGGGSQQYAAEQIVRQTIGHLSQEIGGGRCNQHDIRLLGQPDMGHFFRGLTVKQLGIAPLLGQGLHGQGGDKLLGGIGHHRQHPDSFFGQTAG